MYRFSFMSAREQYRPSRVGPARRTSPCLPLTALQLPDSSGASPQLLAAAKQLPYRNPPAVSPFSMTG